MRKIAKSMILTIGMMLAILLTGCSDESFGTLVDSELFENVPLMTGESINYSELEDVGGENYNIWAYDTSLEEYKSYLKVLEEDGFKKYVDNGVKGLEEYIYTSHYQKDNLLVVVTYMPKLQSTMITACMDAPISERLFYDESYVADNIVGSKTKLTMPELYNAGNSFVFQLKNGHFIINDGGDENDIEYLIDYLEAKAPNGEKPIVEAWVVTHSHEDHMGVFVGLMNNPELFDRFYVEEVYFTESNEISHEERGGSAHPGTHTFFSKTVPSSMKSTTGSAPNVYRMRTGERYYFNDITMDVVYTLDLLNYKEWKTWNATSTVLMYTIEGQKVLMTADTDYECQKLMLDIYEDEYFDLTVYQTPHHGGNVYNEFSRHLKVQTILYPSPDLNRSVNALLGRFRQNEFLKSLAKESMNWTDGGVVLTFPYEVGTYERLPLTEWTHHEELPNRLQSK